MFSFVIHERETIASYGYRIAKASGLGSFTELCDLMGISIKAVVTGSPNQFARFADYAGCAQEDLAKSILETAASNRIQIGQNRENALPNYRPAFRFCPLCHNENDKESLEETCLGRNEWLSSAVQTCLKHHVQLIGFPARVTAQRFHEIAGGVDMLRQAINAGELSITGREPNQLEVYIGNRLNGVNSPDLWIDQWRLDVVIRISEILGALEHFGPKAVWPLSFVVGSEALQLTGFKVLQGGRGEIAALLPRTLASNCNRQPYNQAFGSAFSPIYSKRNDPNYHELCQICVEFIRANFAVTGTTQIFGIEVKGAEPIGFRGVCRREGGGTSKWRMQFMPKRGETLTFLMSPQYWCLI